LMQGFYRCTPLGWLLFFVAVFCCHLALFWCSRYAHKVMQCWFVVVSCLLHLIVVFVLFSHKHNFPLPDWLIQGSFYRCAAQGWLLSFSVFCCCLPFFGVCSGYAHKVTNVDLLLFPAFCVWLLFMFYFPTNTIPPLPDWLMQGSFYRHAPQDWLQFFLYFAAACPFWCSFQICTQWKARLICCSFFPLHLIVVFVLSPLTWFPPSGIDWCKVAFTGMPHRVDFVVYFAALALFGDHSRKAVTHRGWLIVFVFLCWPLCLVQIDWPIFYWHCPTVWLLFLLMYFASTCSFLCSCHFQKSTQG